MTVDANRSLRMTRRFDAAPERVFAAWITPELARQWLFTDANDEESHVEIDARVGGAWRITARRDGVDYTASGEYLEIDRPHRLVFSYAMLQFSPNSDRITVDIAPDGTGSLMTFTQEGVEIAEELRQVPAGEVSESEQGWGQTFDGLARVLS